MLKKYGIPISLILLLTVLCLFGINYPAEKSLKRLLPVVAYQTEPKEAAAIWIKERTEELLPWISSPKISRIAAKREDEIPLKKIKPVELLTMMEFENLEEEWVQKSGEEKIQMPENSRTPDHPPIWSETEELQKENTFVPHTMQNKVDLKELSDFDTLVRSFYTIDSVAMVGSDTLDAEALAGVDLRISQNVEKPQILIYHTHSQEGFADSVPGDADTSIMAVGERLSQILQDEYGYQVLHYEGKYDVESRDSAYSRALPDIKRVLEENPSIEVVIDLHRDAVSDESKKLVMDLDGRPTARFMFFNGVSCTKKTGNISYLENPNQRTNLAFSFQMKKAAEEYYPGLTRKNYIHGYRYNMHLCPRTLLIELGAQNNTLEEAFNACDPLAHILDMVLTGA